MLDLYVTTWTVFAVAGGLAVYTLINAIGRWFNSLPKGE